MLSFYQKKISIKLLRENGYIIRQVQTGTILVNHPELYSKQQIILPILFL